MTEADWSSCESPSGMLAALGKQVSTRKARLFACACCRLQWHRLTYKQIRQVVETSERYADSLVDWQELDRAHHRAQAALELIEERKQKALQKAIRQFRVREEQTPEDAHFGRTIDFSGEAITLSSHHLDFVIRDSSEASYIAARLTKMQKKELLRVPVLLRRHTDEDGKPLQTAADQCAILRDLFANPFRPVSLRPEWLQHNEAVVVRIARTLYDEQRFEEMPILADALEEAGCTDTQVLHHCRQPGRHFRGCFVLDQILGQS